MAASMTSMAYLWLGGLASASVSGGVAGDRLGTRFHGQTGGCPLQGGAVDVRGWTTSTKMTAEVITRRLSARARASQVVTVRSCTAAVCSPALPRARCRRGCGGGRGGIGGADPGGRAAGRVGQAPADDGAVRDEEYHVEGNADAALRRLVEDIEVAQAGQYGVPWRAAQHRARLLAEVADVVRAQSAAASGERRAAGVRGRRERSATETDSSGVRTGPRPGACRPSPSGGRRSRHRASPGRRMCAPKLLTPLRVRDGRDLHRSTCEAGHFGQ